MIRKTFAGPQPSLTRGEDRPQPACAGRPEPYDVLHDLTSGPVFKAAQREAQILCGRCPLAATCLTENQREPWARAIRGRKGTSTSREVCGTWKGSYQHAKHGEENCAACRKYMRDRKRARVARAEQKHGTDTGYSRHRKAGEEACRPCLDAHREAERQRAARKREAAA